MEKKSGKNIIPIVFATNDNYAPYAGVCITSLILNSSKDYFYDIYIFHTDLSQEIISKFLEMKGENYSITLKNVNEYIDKEINLYENFHFSKEMYYRILIPTILSQYKRVIYLDCDMLVIGDISELFNVDLDGCIIGGVNDVMHHISKNYVSQIVKLNPEKYINSGMLVIDCVKFKREKIKEKCFKILNTSGIKFRYPDQDIINLSCNGKIKFLDSKWNYIWHYNFPRVNKKDLLLSDEDQKEYEKKSNNIKIIHYTSNIKPWNNYNTKYTKIYFEYIRKNKQFKNIIFERFNSIRFKNYITFQSFDIFNDKAVIVGAYYTIEDYLYHNSIFITINNQSKPLRFTYSRNIDLRNNCYVQSFFKVEINLKETKTKPISINFSRKIKPNEHLPILTGKCFPIDEKANSKLIFKFNYQQKVLELKNKSLIIRNCLDFSVRKYEKEIKKNLKQINTKRSRKSIFIRRLYYFTKPFIKKEIWFISDRENLAGDNGEAFFKYLKNNTPKKTKVYFVLNKKSPDYKRLKKFGKILQPQSIKYDLLFLHCKKIISSHIPWNIIEPFPLTYIKDLLFDKKIVFLQHGITKDDISESYSRINQGINLFITAAQREYDSIVDNPKYCFSRENVALTGFSRYDNLENEPQKIIYIIPTWRKYLTFGAEKNNFVKSQFFKYYSNLLVNKKLIATLKRYNYVLKFIPHELMRPYFNNFKSESENVIIENNNISYSEIFKSGSLLITDYSSVAFDFAYLKKPIIYYQFDENEFFKNHTYSKGYFSYSEDGFGEVIKNEKELVNLIESKLSNNCKMDLEYIKRVDNFFKYNDKNNSERILKAICKYDRKKESLIKRMKVCFKQNGLKYTLKRIFIKLFRG